MKKIIFIFAFTLLTLTSFGQNVICISQPTPEMLNPNNFTNRFNTVQDNGLPMVIGVKFHGVHETDGSDLYNINEERFLKVIASLNINFNQFNIFFKYRGYGIINNSDYVGYSPPIDLMNTLVGLSTQQGDYDENAINIFINNSGNWSYGNNMLLTTTLQDSVAFNGISPFYDYHVCRAMGYSLGLLDINIGVGSSPVPVTIGVPACIGSPFMSKAYFSNNPLATYQAEHVTRDSNDIVNYNADIAGDMVVDTQAFFQLAYTNYCGNDYQYFQQNAEVVDNVNVMYNCTAAESHNFMVNFWDNGKPNSFTAGQGARMRQYIISNPSIFNPFLNLLGNGNSDISVLFEPYSSTDIGGNVVSTSDNYNGTASICRARLREHKFQPGFDYVFPDNNGTDPINVSKYDFPVPPVCLNTFDYPITIAQLGTSPTNSGIVPLVCTKGVICNDEPYIGGRIFSTQILGSMNITIEELDAIKVKDPDLYNKLLSQYYYILKKETISGAKTEEVFYKP